MSNPQRVTASEFLERIETADQWIIEDPDSSGQYDIILHVEKGGQTETFLSPNLLTMNEAAYNDFMSKLKILTEVH